MSSMYLFRPFSFLLVTTYTKSIKYFYKHFTKLIVIEEVNSEEKVYEQRALYKNEMTRCAHLMSDKVSSPKRNIPITWFVCVCKQQDT